MSVTVNNLPLTNIESIEINVFLFGQSHYDPALFQYLVEKLRNLYQQGISIIVGEESAQDISLSQRIELTEFDILSHFELTKLCSLLQNSNTKISSKQKANFLNHCHQKVKEFFKSNFDQIIHDICHENLASKSSSLFNARTAKFSLLQVLSALNIPYCGLELPDKQREKIGADLEKSRKISQEAFNMTMKKWEPIRMKEMANNTFNAIKSLENTGGVMCVINLGTIHAHRLAAYLSQKLLQSPLSKNVKVNIIPLRIYANHKFYQSAYENTDENQLDNRKERVLQQIAFHQQFDSEIINNYCSSNSCIEVDFNWNDTSECFESPILEDIFTNSTRAVKEKEDHAVKTCISDVGIGKHADLIMGYLYHAARQIHCITKQPTNIPQLVFKPNSDKSGVNDNDFKSKSKKKKKKK